MESFNECTMPENGCEIIYPKTVDSNKKEINETIECDQIINGKIYHIALTFNHPSSKALSDFAEELIKIYNYAVPNYTELEAA